MAANPWRSCAQLAAITRHLYRWALWDYKWHWPETPIPPFCSSPYNTYSSSLVYYNKFSADLRLRPRYPVAMKWVPCGSDWRVVPQCCWRGCSSLSRSDPSITASATAFRRLVLSRIRKWTPSARVKMFGSPQSHCWIGQSSLTFRTIPLLSPNSF